MGHLSRLLLIAAASAVAAAPSASSNKFTIEVAQQAQVILGVGEFNARQLFEGQADMLTTRRRQCDNDRLQPSTRFCTACAALSAQGQDCRCIKYTGHGFAIAKLLVVPSSVLQMAQHPTFSLCTRRTAEIGRLLASDLDGLARAASTPACRALRFTSRASTTPLPKLFLAVGSSRRCTLYRFLRLPHCRLQPHRLASPADRRLTSPAGYEIQSDSIGSGNNGLPESNSSVPNDLVQSEKDRFFSEMLQGFRFCRLAMGLYFRGLTPDSKHIVGRWEGQAAGLAEMAQKSGIEGFEVEYWSPPPGWKSTNNYIDGTLTGFDAQTLDAFSDAVVVDAQYLQSNGIHPVWWGLQNEPPVGPNGCTYSCCGYDAHGYYLAFNATASKIRTAFPDVVIHASSWSGQYLSPEISADPAALALVDAWTFHRVGADSNDQMQNQDYFLKGAAGKAVLNNEFEYLDDYTDAYRTINTAQSIMNWMVFENSPTWFWLHALKPLGHAEASGYGLGYWQPWNTSEAPSTVASDEAGTAGHAVVAEGAPSSSPVLPGYWIFEPRNWNAMAGFTKYMPWDSVRVNVTEETVLEDVRILAYLYSPSMARWLQPDFVQPRVEPGSSGRTLRDDATARAAATKLGFVVTNRYNTTSVDVTVDISGIDTSAGLPTFDGYLYNPNATDVSLGSVTAQTNTSTGLPYLALTLQPTTIQFWVQQ